MRTFPPNSTPSLRDQHHGRRSLSLPAHRDKPIQLSTVSNVLNGTQGKFADPFANIPPDPAPPAMTQIGYHYGLGWTGK